mmetsp:Transcript_11644/g.37003  ORF Transcript_11644/g.37003 Transcript_11644/m.37003 type:complete len:83 (+) Transcript_11644:61-309(+)
MARTAYGAGYTVEDPEYTDVPEYWLAYYNRRDPRSILWARDNMKCRVVQPTCNLATVFGQVFCGVLLVLPTVTLMVAVVATS